MTETQTDAQTMSMWWFLWLLASCAIPLHSQTKLQLQLQLSPQIAFAQIYIFHPGSTTEQCWWLKRAERHQKNCLTDLSFRWAFRKLQSNVVSFKLPVRWSLFTVTGWFTVTSNPKTFCYWTKAAVKWNWQTSALPRREALWFTISEVLCLIWPQNFALWHWLKVRRKLLRHLFVWSQAWTPGPLGCLSSASLQATFPGNVAWIQTTFTKSLQTGAQQRKNLPMRMMLLHCGKGLPQTPWRCSAGSWLWMQWGGVQWGK